MFQKSWIKSKMFLSSSTSLKFISTRWFLQCSQQYLLAKTHYNPFFQQVHTIVTHVFFDFFSQYQWVYFSILLGLGPSVVNWQKGTICIPQHTCLHRDTSNQEISTSEWTPNAWYEAAISVGGKLAGSKIIVSVSSFLPWKCNIKNY